MIKILPTIFLLIFSLQSFAQSEPALDSFHSLQWVEPAWEISSAYIFNDTGTDDISRDRYIYDEDGVRALNNRDEWFYNADGDLLKYQESLYLEDIDDWLLFRVRNYTYDADGNSAVIELLEYSTETFQLEKDIKFEYLDYTPEGDFQASFVFTPDDAGEWILANSFKQELYYENGLLDSLVRIATTIDPPQYIVARSYEYNADGNRTLERWWTQYDETIGNFSLNFWYEYMYLDGLLQSRTRYDYDENIPEGALSFTDLYEYDEDGNNTCRINQDWDDEAQALINDSKQLNFWSTTVAIENIEYTYWNTTWFNESGRILNLNIKNLNPTKEYNLSIFNVQGKLLHNSQLKNTSDINQKFNLSSGSFFVLLKDEDGFKNTTTVIMSH